MVSGKTPSLLSSGNGGITFATVERKSPCVRCKEPQNKGLKVGLLKVAASGFSKQKRLCLDCVSLIVQQTQKELDVIKKLL